MVLKEFRTCSISMGNREGGRFLYIFTLLKKTYFHDLEWPKEKVDFTLQAGIHVGYGRKKLINKAFRQDRAG